jgi:hypothetical protein
MIASFGRLLAKARTDDERDHIRNIGKTFVKDLNALLKK